MIRYLCKSDALVNAHSPPTRITFSSLDETSKVLGLKQEDSPSLNLKPET